MPRRISNSLRLFVTGLIALCTVLSPKCLRASDDGARLIARDSVGVSLRTGSHLMRVEICAPNVIHVVVSPTQSIPAPLVPVVIHKWPESAFDVKETGTEVQLVTSTLRITINRASAAVTFSDSSGRRVLQEVAGSGESLTPKVIQQAKTWQVAQSFDSPEGEFLYGLGQHQEGWLNLRGVPLRLRQVNTQISMPMMLSSRGYGLLWNNASITDFNPADEVIPVDAKTGEGAFTTSQAGEYGFLVESDTRDRLTLTVNGAPVVDLKNMWVPYSAGGTLKLGANQQCRVVASGGPSGVTVHLRRPAATTAFRSEAGSAIDYYFFYGPDLNQVIADYRVATGEAPLFPRWAYGFWQCRERYSSQEQILAVAKEFREKQIPVDVLVQDWQYWGKLGWNAMKFDEHYPRPSVMMDDLHSRNLHLALSVWSRFGEDTDRYKEFKERSLLLPGEPWVDMFNPSAQKLFWESMNNPLFKDGIDAWWLDATEPEGDPLAGRRTYLGPGEMVHNAYPLYVTQAVYDGQRASTNSKRVVILTRSAFPGQQRNAAASWSGDIGGNWETLRRQIPAGLNFSMSGIPYWTTDIGGFFRPEDQYTSPAYRELLIRWFEYGSFCPLFRIHGYKTETEMWKFGDQVESVLRKYDSLRYRLLPYIYSSAWNVTHAGATMMRALPMDYREDAKTGTISDQFMFGSELLVNPVTEAKTSGRNVYLPGSGRWIDFWTGEKEAGGGSIWAKAPLDVIPIYVKAGSILPLGAIVQDASESPDPLEIRVYGGADASFQLYEDEGNNYDYEKGAYSTIKFDWNEKARILSIGDRLGRFPRMEQERKFRVVWVRPGVGSGLEPVSRCDAELTYKGKALKIHAP